jgi:hypothetical protein
MIGRHLSEEIHVQREVQRAAAPFGQIEHKLDVSIAFAVERRRTADPVGSELERLVQEIESAGRLEDSELGVGEDLQVQVWGKLFLEPQEQLDTRDPIAGKTSTTARTAVVPWRIACRRNRRARRSRDGGVNAVPETESR